MNQLTSNNTKYLAFLRAINVGGKNQIKMNDLQKIFLALGLSNVLTYIQSGNISFESVNDDINILEQRLKSYLERQIGYEIHVMIRTLTSIQNMVKGNPFQNLDIDNRTKYYVSFFADEPTIRPSLPLINFKEGLELFLLDKREAYIISKEVNGRYGFPNNFVEKEINVISTTRNWKTISGITEQYIES
jgi:uncharacterized protein (DUF1697 family)